MPTITLAIEASQRVAGVALRDRQGIVHTEPVASSKRHDDDLMPAIDRLVSRCMLSPRDLQLVGVSIGPGGFTGLRIAITTAKMLALTLGVPLVGVPGAVVAAHSMADDEIARSAHGDLLVALAVKRTTLWLTRLLWRDASERHAQIVWSEHPAHPAALVEFDAIDYAGAGALLGDEYLPESVRAACAARGIAVLRPRFDPAALLRATEFLMEKSGPIDPDALAPLYAREPEAVRLFKGRSATTDAADR